MRLAYWVLGLISALALLIWARDSHAGAAVLIAVTFVALGFGLGHFVGVTRETRRFLRITGMSSEEWRSKKAKDERTRDPRWIKAREMIVKALGAPQRKDSSKVE